jgi:CubicO group peptidase (beta-lactamase class C family)
MANALRHEQSALESLLVLEQRRDDAYTELVEAASDLERALHSADRVTAVSVRVALEDLGQIGEQFAFEAVRRAELAGLPPSLVESALAVVSDGAELASEGRTEEAFETWQTPFLLGEFPVFSMDLFEQNINDALGSETVGYSYALSQNGSVARADGFGFARVGGADDPLVIQSSDKEMNIASISKTLTATAVLRLMENRNIVKNGAVDADALISPYLPPDWVQGPGVDELTFRHLLTHQSGLNLNDSSQSYDYESLRTTIATGVNATQTFQYQNANFSLFRVMLPYLWGLSEETIEAFGATPDVASAAIYITYVRLAILQPAGVTGSCAPTDSEPTLMYRFPLDGRDGLRPEDWTLICGSGGWFFTATDLAAAMSARRFNNGVLSPAARTTMDMNFFGWMDPNNYNWGNGAWGVYRNHGGDLLYGSPSQGIDTCVMEFPIGVQATLLINSVAGSYPYQCQLLQDAFDAAWQYP